MKVLIDISHPAHVHLFKNLVWELQDLGIEVIITAKDKEITLDLLKKYGIEFIAFGNEKDNKLSLFFNWIKRDLKLLKVAKRYSPDLFIGMHNPAIAHVAKIRGKESIIFTDTEHAKLANILTFPFVSKIVTPSCFLQDHGKKHFRYNGYHELSYLHPDRFTPDPSVLEEINLSTNDPFIVVRFVSWQASHDIGGHGICDKVGLVKALEHYGRVIITSEGVLPSELEQYRIKVSPDKLHDLLYYATLYVGEGATTASECAVLGTHAIYVNTLGLGYITELSDEYQLVSDFSREECNNEAVITEAKKLLDNPNLRLEGKRKRERILQDNCDLSSFMISFVENYLDSIEVMKDSHRIEKPIESQ